jgi:hypothetical protein
MQAIRLLRSKAHLSKKETSWNPSKRTLYNRENTTSLALIEYLEENLLQF